MFKEKIKMLIDKETILKSRFNIKMGLILVISIIILGGLIWGNIMFSVRQQVKTKITDNKAEEFFYAGNYEGALEEYNKLAKEEMNNSWWQIKISEVYSVKGDLEKSRKYIENAKTLSTSEKDENTKAKVLNYIIFTEFMNKDYKAALDDGKDELVKYPKDKNIYKTMFTVYMANNDSKSASDMISSYPLDKKSAYDMAEFSRMLMIVGRWDEGLVNLKNAWNIDKDEYKIFDVLSQSFSYNKDILLDKITTLSKNNPQDIVFKIWLAKIYSMDPATSDQASNLLSTIGQGDGGKIECNVI